MISQAELVIKADVSVENKLKLTMEEAGDGELKICRKLNEDALSQRIFKENKKDLKCEEINSNQVINFIITKEDGSHYKINNINQCINEEIKQNEKNIFHILESNSDSCYNSDCSMTNSLNISEEEGEVREKNNQSVSMRNESSSHDTELIESTKDNTKLSDKNANIENVPSQVSANLDVKLEEMKVSLFAIPSLCDENNKNEDIFCITEDTISTIDEVSSQLLEKCDKSAKSNLRFIIIDGSNVAISHGNKDIFSCRGISIAVEWFKQRGHQEIVVFVPLWRKEVTKTAAPIMDQDILNELEKEGILCFTPARRVRGKRVVCYDDRYILNLAADTDGIVVSNDNYRDLINENTKFKFIIEERLLMYTFVNDRFMPPDDPLGREGPSLDNFLCKTQIYMKNVPPSCPWGKKCTYGNKCKFYHSERVNLNNSTEVPNPKINISVVKDLSAIKESTNSTCESKQHVNNRTTNRKAPLRRTESIVHDETFSNYGRKDNEIIPRRPSFLLPHSSNVLSNPSLTLTIPTPTDPENLSGSLSNDKRVNLQILDPKRWGFEHAKLRATHSDPNKYCTVSSDHLFLARKLSNEKKSADVLSPEFINKQSIQKNKSSKKSLFKSSKLQMPQNESLHVRSVSLHDVSDRSKNYAFMRKDSAVQDSFVDDAITLDTENKPEKCKKVLRQSSSSDPQLHLSTSDYDNDFDQNLPTWDKVGNPMKQLKNDEIELVPIKKTNSENYLISGFHKSNSILDNSGKSNSVFKSEGKIPLRRMPSNSKNTIMHQVSPSDTKTHAEKICMAKNLNYSSKKCNRNTPKESTYKKEELCSSNSSSTSHVNNLHYYYANNIQYVASSPCCNQTSTSEDDIVANGSVHCKSLPIMTNTSFNALNESHTLSDFYNSMYLFRNVDPGIMLNARNDQSRELLINEQQLILGREQLYQNLCGLFPRVQVLHALKCYPHENDPRILCAFLLGMST